jgi:hypothetical protein
VIRDRFGGSQAVRPLAHRSASSLGTENAGLRSRGESATRMQPIVGTEQELKYLFLAWNIGKDDPLAWSPAVHHYGGMQQKPRSDNRELASPVFPQTHQNYYSGAFSAKTEVVGLI